MWKPVLPLSPAALFFEFHRANRARFRFIPQPDITAYELALLMNLLFPFDEEKMFKQITQWPETIFRHLENGGELFTKILELKYL